MISIAAADPLPAPPREPSASGSPRPGCRPRTATSRPTATAYHRRLRARRAGLRRHRRRRATCSPGVHSECLTGDVFGSRRCDCGPQLDEALAAIVQEGRGVVVYLRGHEGRGIGLLAQAAGLPAAGRRPRHRRRQPRPRAAGRRARLRRRRPDPARPRRPLRAPAHQQPRQGASLEGYGVPVAERVPLAVRPNDDNRRYLPTKRDRMGHQLARRYPALRSAPIDVLRRRTPRERSRSTRRQARSTATTCASPWSRRAGTSR